MSTLISLSASAHLHAGWRPPSDFRHSAGLATVPVVHSEISHVIPTMPLALQARAAANGRGLSFELVALLSPVPGKNLMLRTDGQWLIGYVPAHLRAYPFAVARRADQPDSDERLVCINADSGCLVDNAQDDPQAQRLFADDGQPAAAFARVIEFLQAQEQARRLTQQAMAALAAHKLIAPWQLLPGEAGSPQQTPDLFRIDPEALAALDATALETLHRSGGLMIAHAQLLSMQRTRNFPHLLKMQQSAQSAVPALDFEHLFNSGNETLSFSNLQ
ncbi:MAG: SapC family protein [Chromatiales bacterium]|nr:SapC family protein [Chromatiales bacterium]